MGLFTPKYPKSDTAGATAIPSSSRSGSSGSGSGRQSWREKRREKEWVRQEMINQGN